MRNPVLTLMIGVILATIALVLIIFPFGIGEPRHGELIRMSSATPGFFILALALFLSVRTLLLIKQRSALLRGEGTIARWQINASEWDLWRTHDAERSALFPSLRNKLRPKASPAPLEGVPVVVGTRAVVVGGAVAPLSGFTYWPPAWSLADVSPAPGSPGSIEFSRFVRGKNARIELVRIPLGAAGKAHAQTVIRHFSTAIPEEHKILAREGFAPHFQALAGDLLGAQHGRFLNGLFNGGLIVAVAGVIGLINWYLFSGAQRPPLGPDMLHLLGVGASFMVVLGLALVLGASLGRTR